MEYIAENRHGNLISWRIRRPERLNAIGLKVIAELTQLMDGLEEQCQPWRDGNAAPLKKMKRSPPLPCRLLHITADPIASSKGKIWIAGGDLKDQANFENQSESTNYAKNVSQFCTRLEHLPIPVVVSIDGAAIGGGAELALAGDFRYATQESSLHFRQLSVGLPTGFGGCQRLVESVGRSVATHILMTGGTLASPLASSLGLFHQVTQSSDHLQNAVIQLSQMIASFSPEAVATQKNMVLQAARPLRDENLREELTLFANTWGNPTHFQNLKNFKKQQDSMDSAKR